MFSQVISTPLRIRAEFRDGEQRHHHCHYYYYCYCYCYCYCYYCPGAGLPGPAGLLSPGHARGQGALAQAVCQQPPPERSTDPVSR